MVTAQHAIKALERSTDSVEHLRNVAPLMKPSHVDLSENKLAGEVAKVTTKTITFDAL